MNNWVQTGVIPGIRKLDPPKSGMTKLNTLFAACKAWNSTNGEANHDSMMHFVLSLPLFSPPSQLHRQFAQFVTLAVDDNLNGDISKEEFLSALINGVIAFDDDTFAWSQVIIHGLTHTLSLHSFCLYFVFKNFLFLVFVTDFWLLARIQCIISEPRACSKSRSHGYSSTKCRSWNEGKGIIVGSDSSAICSCR